MPEPTPNPARGVPPHPPSEFRVDEETREDIGYSNDPDPETARRIAEGIQQSTNEQGLRAAHTQTPDAKREAELIAKREAGQPLDRDEIQFLAQRRARRENKNT
ncbi:MAG: hypothetical protein QG675_552 [Patescibacteria group bacterium]|jgi:hypothetical protein|nr:hypothetical protein [Patescibacteria group bacterium]